MTVNDAKDDQAMTRDSAKSAPDVVLCHLEWELDLAKELMGVLNPSLDKVKQSKNLTMSSTVMELLSNNKVDLECVDIALNYLESLQLGTSGAVKKKVHSSGLQLGKLLRPSLLLNTLRLLASREKGVSIDGLKVVCSWNSNSCPDSSTHLTISGYKLEGAVFDGFRLKPCQEVTPKHELICHFPLSFRTANCYRICLNSHCLGSQLTPKAKEAEFQSLCTETKHASLS